MQREQGSIEQGQRPREDDLVPAFVRTEAPAAGARPNAGTTWAGSAFDLAQGLEVTEFEAKISLEDLHELFR